MFSKLPRHSQFLLYDEGYEAPSTEGFNIDNPLMEFKDTGINDNPFEKISADTPRRLTIRSLIEAVPLTNFNTSIQKILNDKVYNPYSLYNLNALKGIELDFAKYSQNKSIKLLYSEIINDFSDPNLLFNSLNDNVNLKLTKESVIYEKQFYVQTKTSLLLKKSLIKPTWVVTPPGSARGVINLAPVYSYGGYYKPGTTKISDISQSYFMFNHEGSLTVPALQATLYWHEQRCPPPFGGILRNGEKVEFLDPPVLYQESSLAGDIEKGRIQISLEGENSFTYQSYAYTQNDPASPFIDLRFKLME